MRESGNDPNINNHNIRQGSQKSISGIWPTSVNTHRPATCGFIHIAYRSVAMKVIYRMTLVLCMDLSCGTWEIRLSMRHQSGDACFIGNFRRDFLKIEFFEFFVRDQNRAGGGYAFLTALEHAYICTRTGTQWKIVHLWAKILNKFPRKLNWYFLCRRTNVW